MSIENLLKDEILKEYRSIREFCMQNDFPYSTIDNIFRRGLLKSSVSIIIGVCDRLGIDIDELISHKIVYKSKHDSTYERITSLYFRLDHADRNKLEGFAEGMLASDKYEEKKQKRA